MTVSGIPFREYTLGRRARLNDFLRDARIQAVRPDYSTVQDGGRPFIVLEVVLADGRPYEVWIDIHEDGERESLYVGAEPSPGTPDAELNDTNDLPDSGAVWVNLATTTDEDNLA